MKSVVVQKSRQLDCDMSHPRVLNLRMIDQEVEMLRWNARERARTKTDVPRSGMRTLEEQPLFSIASRVVPRSSGHAIISDLVAWREPLCAATKHWGSESDRRTQWSKN
jgi:hypothetical protein